MQVPGVQRAREFDRVGGAADVHGGVLLGGRGHVVDRGQVEHVVDLAAQLLDPLALEAEQWFTQVAEDGHDAFAAHGSDRDAPVLDQVVQARDRAVAHEHVHLALALVQELLDEAAADEAGRACDEVVHGRSWQCRTPRGSAASCGPATPLRDHGFGLPESCRPKECRTTGDKRERYTPAPAPPRPSPSAKRVAPRAPSAKTSGPVCGLQGEPVRERHAETFDRGATVGEHRALGKARQSLG